MTRKLPLLGTPGFEAANLLVIFFAPWFLFISTLKPRSLVKHNFTSDLIYNTAFCALNIALYSSLLFANSFEIKSCSPGAGWAPFFVILIPPIFLNITVGTLIASLFYKTWLRLIFLFLIAIIYSSSIFYSWWLHPDFRVLTHGSLLITSDLLNGGELTIGIIGFRAATFLLASAIALFGIVFLSTFSSRLSFNKKLSLFLIIGGFFTCSYILHKGSISLLGKNRAQLMADYSLSLSQDFITIKANPHNTREKDAKAILDEALLYKDRLFSRLGVDNKKEIIIFLHHDEHEKFLYTGAKNVHFANPKHREIHISSSEIPHPVLGHELAHILIGEESKTLWGVPGSYRIIPNLALTEGLAMALTPELVLDHDLTLFEQAQALFKASMKPDLSSLFSSNPLTFMSNNIRSSYIFAGAFLEFLIKDLKEEQQRIALKKIIRAGTIAAYFKTSQNQQRAFEQFEEELRKPLENYATVWALKNFTPNSIVTSNCNNQHKKEQEEFFKLLLNQETYQALKTLKDIPTKRKIDLLLFSVNEALKKQHFEQALLLTLATIDIMEKKRDPRIHELMLLKTNLHFYFGNIEQAQKNLEAIDLSWLSSTLKRKLHITEEALALFKYPEMHYLSKALNETLLDISSLGEGARINFAKAIVSMDAKKLSPLSYYLYARILMRAHRFQEALFVMKKLLENPKSLPLDIFNETELMAAQTFDALNEFSEAKKIYKQLELRIKKDSQILAIKDALERIDRKDSRAK